MGIRRIVITGGPGGGKTTLWRELSAAFSGRVAAVPEVATLMFENVFPSVQSPRERHAVQRAIFHVQHNLEDVHAARLVTGQVLLCDRGTPDGGGYWPEGHEAFFASVLSDWATELERYEAVVFLETAAVRGLSIADGNTVRTEDLATAVAIDERLRAVWSPHKRLVHVPCHDDFAVKIGQASRAVRDLLASG